MDMHMFGAMYGFHDRFTLTAMLPFISQSMSHNHQSPNIGHFRRGTEGLGDLKLGGIYNSHSSKQLDILLNGGISVPFGSITQDDQGHLPYPMQLGSGTIDLLPGITFRGPLPFYKNLTWGAQLSSILRTGVNRQGYRRGNRYAYTGWIAHDLTPNTSGSVRISHQKNENIVGTDKDIPAIMAPGMDPNLQGGERTDLSFGVNHIIGLKQLNGHRIAAEVGLPVYQYLDGPQLGTSIWATLGWQYAF